MSNPFSVKALAAWREVPDWVAALASACDRQSQSAVAQHIDVNAAYLSYAIRGVNFEYHSRVEDAVRARLMGETVACPVVGEIAPDICGSHRRSRLKALGPVQKRLRLTCPTCIHNNSPKED